MLQIVVTKALFIDRIVFLSINIYSDLNHQFFIYVKVVSFWKYIRDEINASFPIPKRDHFNVNWLNYWAHFAHISLTHGLLLGDIGIDRMGKIERLR